MKQDYIEGYEIGFNEGFNEALDEIMGLIDDSDEFTDAQLIEEIHEKLKEFRR